MANEYVINAVDAVGVADVIRERAEITEKLNWPEGWKDAIRGISSLNFEVVGGTVQPEQQKEYTIWVDTDTEIANWSFAADEPDELINGMVWITSSDNGVINLEVLKKNSILLRIHSAKQYINGSWVNKPAYVYQNGKWMRIRHYLYYHGEEYADVTGGWITNGWRWRSSQVGNHDASNIGVTKNENFIRLNNVSTGNTVALIGTKNKIDFKNTDTLVFVVDVAAQAHDGFIHYGATSEGVAEDSEAHSGLNLATGNDQLIIVDTSGLADGKYHVIAGQTIQGDIRIKEVYLQ